MMDVALRPIHFQHIGNATCGAVVRGIPCELEAFFVVVLPSDKTDAICWLHAWQATRGFSQ